jgi:hypothetical protein
MWAKKSHLAHGAIRFGRRRVTSPTLRFALRPSASLEVHGLQHAPHRRASSRQATGPPRLGLFGTSAGPALLTPSPVLYGARVPQPPSFSHVFVRA